jgi:hypothetical protein
VKLSLAYRWECAPETFWALYFDPAFVLRLHLEGLGSTSAEVISQEGDLAAGLTRTLRYGQKPNSPGPVRKIFGEEIVTTEVSIFTPATSTTTFTLTPGTMADKTQLSGSIALSRGDDHTTEEFALEARVKIFGVGPVVERFIEHQARRRRASRWPTCAASSASPPDRPGGPSGGAALLAAPPRSRGHVASSTRRHRASVSRCASHAVATRSI